MDKLNCNVISDLLPLYIDEVCSPESRELVETHLEECEACRQALEQMKKDVKVESQAGDERKPLKMLKRNLRKKYMIVILCTVLACAALAGIYTAMNLIQTPISYEDIKVSVVQNKDHENQYNLIFNGEDYACLYSTEDILYSDDHCDYYAEILHCERSIWTKMFKRKPLKDQWVQSYTSDPEYSNGYNADDRGIRYTKTVAVYYQATPDSERHLLWEADWYKEMREKEKAAEKGKKK